MNNLRPAGCMRPSLLFRVARMSSRIIHHVSPRRQSFNKFIFHMLAKLFMFYTDASSVTHDSAYENCCIKHAIKMLEM
jgi:hypothetical protein